MNLSGMSKYLHRAHDTRHDNMNEPTLTLRKLNRTAAQVI